MCWKYEHEYEDCLDLIFKDVFFQDENGLNSLLREYGIYIIKEKENEYKKYFFDFLTKCHKNKCFKNMGE